MFKSILAGIVIAVVAMTAAPVIANAAQAGMAARCDSSLPSQQAAVPNCCLTPDCPVFGLSGIANKTVILFSSPTGSTTPMALNPIESSESASTGNKPPPHDPARVSPLPSGVIHQCRNCLNSDDPFSL